MTAIKWIPDKANLFIEGCEDLTLRMWDVNQRPFKPAIEIKVGTNFITSSDIILSASDSPLLATGHRGFNNEGAEVKVWDLRSFNNETSAPLFTHAQHLFTPESVRFLNANVLVSASKDQSMHLIDA